MSELNNLEGIVKWFNISRQYGFVSIPELGDAFVHSSVCPNIPLHENDLVRVDLEKSDRGYQVTKLELC